GQGGGHHVGPAAEPAARLLVYESFGEAVTDRDERFYYGHMVAFRHLDHDARVGKSEPWPAGQRGGGRLGRCGCDWVPGSWAAWSSPPACWPRRRAVPAR